ncbi:hypothetical protein C7974DRAFT_402619 [Boeremia exigua]|uniref:uncharacterized protein n=1 Tax=Boeremia exigua TaxID=749465 RepID=UPI001E8D1205|nr:uncharacterized protein C7974DRAFT_402619 [Boeremia exigua]KAH6616896.1 hypothetical protein C7974DRAFT_402619 [Boeremia exigua]
MVVVSFPTRGFVLNAADVVFRDIRVVGSLVGRNQQLRQLLAFAATHAVAAVTRVFALEDINHRGPSWSRRQAGHRHACRVVAAAAIASSYR